MFTEAIEDHLALKKQNAHLDATMPLSSFDVGDSLDRFPGGPVRPAVGAFEDGAAAAAAAPEQGAFADPGVTAAFTPAQVADATTAPSAFQAGGNAAEAQVLEGEFRRPLEPLNGMTPMLSLVEDIDEDDVTSTAAPEATQLMQLTEEEPSAPVLRFPGGVGPRVEATELAPAATTAAATTTFEQSSFADDQPTGEQPVIVIDADEPLAPLGGNFDQHEFSVPGPRRKKGGSFFGLGRKKKKDDFGGEGGWFSGNPRDFSWDD